MQRKKGGKRGGVSVLSLTEAFLYNNSVLKGSIGRRKEESNRIFAKRALAKDRRFIEWSGNMLFSRFIDKFSRFLRYYEYPISRC